MKLSIIIPAYNVENYIEPCLQSCLEQDIEISDYEIIVVNDGSTDNTEEKVHFFAEAHPNLYLISQSNNGVGAARNKGVNCSKGEYIYFLDADDYIAKNTLGVLTKIIEHYNPDLLWFSSQNVFDNSFINSNTSELDITSNQVINGVEFLGSHDYKPEVWWYFIKKSFYIENKIVFYDKKFVQDAYITPTLISKAERIVHIPYDVHRYRVSNVSITRNTSEEHLKTHLKDLCYAIEKLFYLKKDLINTGITNSLAIKRIQAKQQYYVFIAITRFMRSSLKPKELKGMLSDFKTIDAYPLNVYWSTLSLKDPLNLTLTFIFNRSFLL